MLRGEEKENCAKLGNEHSPSPAKLHTWASRWRHCSACVSAPGLLAVGSQDPTPLPASSPMGHLFYVAKLGPELIKSPKFGTNRPGLNGSTPLMKAR